MSNSQFPGVSLDKFEDIVEGRNQCPTLGELSELAKQARTGPIEPQSSILQHLEVCSDCRSSFDALRA
jgi:hypothetical protein